MRFRWPCSKAVQQDRFNPNVDNARHRKSLESYLDVAGSDRVLRYWELHQPLDEAPVRWFGDPMQQRRLLVRICMLGLFGRLVY